MKLMINGYEVEIKAKNTLLSDKLNKSDTLDLLGQIQIWAWEASELEGTKGLDALARRSKEAWNQIYDYLEEQRAFKNIR